MSIHDTLQEMGIHEELIPRSQATTGYELLEEIIAVIQSEPRRMNMASWVQFPHELEDQNTVPECGVVGCIAGWAVVLRDGYAPLLTQHTDYHFSRMVPNVSIPVRAIELLMGFGVADEAVEEMFNGAVVVPSPDTHYDKQIYPDDPRYIPAVVARIRAFQEEHRDALMAHRLDTVPSYDGTMDRYNRASHTRYVRDMDDDYDDTSDSEYIGDGDDNDTEPS